MTTSGRGLERGDHMSKQAAKQQEKTKHKNPYDWGGSCKKEKGYPSVRRGRGGDLMQKK